MNSLHVDAVDHSTADDLAHRIRCEARTMLTDTREVEAQRWFVQSFCQEGFAYRRHHCADACMSVFQLSHTRSRELYDLTMLEVRRALYDDLRCTEQIISNRLLGTRAAWMVDYRSLMTKDEFTKFNHLMKNLAPYLMLLVVDPTKANNHRRDRNPTIGRQTLELILYGHSDARALF